jgi:hypothetical protein
MPRNACGDVDAREIKIGVAHIVSSTEAGIMARGSVAIVPELGLATGADQFGGRSLRKRIVVAVVLLAFGCAAVALAAASASGDSKLRDTSVLKVGVSDRLDVWRQYQNDEDVNPRKKKTEKADWEKQRSIPDFVDGIIGPSPTAMDEGGSKSRGSFNVKKITDKTDFYYLRITDRSGNGDRIRAELVGSDGYRLDWVGFGEIFTGPIHEGNLGETDYLRVEVTLPFGLCLLGCRLLHLTAPALFVCSLLEASHLSNLFNFLHS